MRRAEALVGRGAMTGGAVEATWMVDRRLWPGTLSNIAAIRSGELGLRASLFRGGPLLPGGRVGSAAPVRRAEALVWRGATTGGAVDATFRIYHEVSRGRTEVVCGDIRGMHACARGRSRRSARWIPETLAHDESKAARPQRGVPLLEWSWVG